MSAKHRLPKPSEKIKKHGWNIVWKSILQLNCGRGLLQTATAHFIANCAKGLLQMTIGTLLQIVTSFIINCDSITNCDVITNYDWYYKLRRLLLQIATAQRIIFHANFKAVYVTTLTSVSEQQIKPNRTKSFHVANSNKIDTWL